MFRWARVQTRGVDFPIEECSRLELLYESKPERNGPTRDEGVDIILVAGLGGHFRQTWQAKGSDQTLWPRDLLPRFYPDIRVHSFQYNTTIRGSTDRIKIADHAGELLELLSQDRGDGDDVSASIRPIIFVGHSLGGMLIKKTLQLAHDSRFLKHVPLQIASHGVMFFATPHHGMEEKAWRQFAEQILRMKAPFPGILPTQKMLDEIGANSQVLRDITEDFGRMEGILNSMAFVNFTEDTLMQGLDQTLVGDGLGWMEAPNKIQRKLEGDHITICKFGSHPSERMSFLQVSDGIRYLLEESPKALEKIGADGRRALHSLCPSGFHGYFMAKEPTQGTCEWIKDRPDFQAWLDDEDDKQMLWIQGPPACGKTYLARHVITELAPAANKEVAHCFLSESVPGRGNIEALLRATLHHALRLERELIPKFLVPPFMKATTADPQIRDDDIWTRDVLIPLWPKVVAEVLKLRPLTLVVDGLDEMDRGCQQAFMDCLGACKKLAGEKWASKLRMLVFSRNQEVEDPLAGQEDFDVYQITREDILPDVVKTVAANLGFAEDELEAIPQEVVEAVDKIAHPESMYLWPATATKELSQLEVNTPSVLNALGGLPQNMTGLYDRVLERMHDRSGPDLSLIIHILRWALFQKDGLRKAEFYTAVALGVALDCHPIGVPTVEELELLEASDIETMVDTHCRQAIELSDGRLRLVHKTLRESLTSSGELPYYDEEPSHAVLGSICVAYLTMRYFADAGIPAEDGNMAQWEAKVSQRIKDRPFVRYAALYWFEHVEASGLSWLSVDQAIAERCRLLRDSTTQFAQSWTEVWRFLTRGGPQREPRECLPESVMLACHIAEPPATPGTVTPWSERTSLASPETPGWLDGLALGTPMDELQASSEAGREQVPPVLGEMPPVAEMSGTKGDGLTRPRLEIAATSIDFEEKTEHVEPEEKMREIAPAEPELVEVELPDLVRAKTISKDQSKTSMAGIKSEVATTKAESMADKEGDDEQTEPELAEAPSIRVCFPEGPPVELQPVYIELDERVLVDGFKQVDSTKLKKGELAEAKVLEVETSTGSEPPEPQPTVPKRLEEQPIETQLPEARPEDTGPVQCLTEITPVSTSDNKLDTKPATPECDENGDEPTGVNPSNINMEPKVTPSNKPKVDLDMQLPDFKSPNVETANAWLFRAPKLLVGLDETGTDRQPEEVDESVEKELKKKAGINGLTGWEGNKGFDLAGGMDDLITGMEGPVDMPEVNERRFLAHSIPSHENQQFEQEKRDSTRHEHAGPSLVCQNPADTPPIHHDQSKQRQNDADTSANYKPVDINAGAVEPGGVTADAVRDSAEGKRRGFWRRVVDAGKEMKEEIKDALAETIKSKRGKEKKKKGK